MWDVLKPTDLEQVQGHLNERRADLLRRHAQELAALEADEADLETLDRLAAAFSGKFKTTAAPTMPVTPVSKKPEPPPVPQPVGSQPASPQPVGPRPHPKPEKRNLSGTNFEVFSRAVAKAGF